MNASATPARLMSDAQFLQAFETLALPPAEFGHAEHLRAAWCCFRHSEDFTTGAARFVTGFRRYVAHIGAEAKYHETITWFYLAQVSERLARSPDAGWEEFRRAHPDLFAHGMSLLKARYRPETLQTSLARRTFVLPDAAPAA